MHRLKYVWFVGLVSACTWTLASEALVKDKQCLQCHAVEKDVIGPSFKRIAFRWKGNPTAEKMLIATIRNGTREGGGQHWSSTTEMPNSWERPLVSQAEAKQIFQWIMRQ
jgi:cytochrome c